jgi:hypothetical protein
LRREGEGEGERRGERIKIFIRYYSEFSNIKVHCIKF